MTPTLDGLSPFGRVLSCVTIAHPRLLAPQQRPGPLGGLTGAADCGGRGARTNLEIVLSGPGPAGLALAEFELRAFDDGKTHLFTDTLGTPWPETVYGGLEATRDPNGRALAVTPDGTFVKYYRLTLEHLS